MKCLRILTAGLGLLLGLLWATGAGAQEPVKPPPPSHRLPLEALPQSVRDRVRQVVDAPTMSASGQPETFACKPTTYHWLLEHQDRAVGLWRHLGARCVDIADRGAGRFGWSDEQGSDVHWDTVYQDSRMRIWYADGKVRPAALLPLVPVQAVIVLHYSHDGSQAPADERRVWMHHQVELYLRTDSRTAALAAALLGPSAQRLADQYAAQLEMFYSALAWYLDQHSRRPESVPSGRFHPVLPLPFPPPAGTGPQPAAGQASPSGAG
jgi:hypothetical protein